MSDDFEIEPMRGLPDVLPAGEKIIWQGAPSWGALAVRAYQARKVAVYFILLFLFYFIPPLVRDGNFVEALENGYAILLLGLVPVGFLVLTGWLAAHVTIYTITTRRIVMRIGIVFSIHVNIPFKVITSADLRTFRRGNGDISLTVSGDQQTSYLVLWPHVRPWHFRPVQPMLRGLPDAAKVAEILGKALQDAAEDEPSKPAATGADQRSLEGREAGSVAAARS